MRAFLRRCWWRGLPLLAPVDDRGRRILAALRSGVDVLVEIIQVKNPRQVKLYFALLTFAYNHAMNPETGEMLFLTPDHAKDAIKIACGAATPVYDPTSGKTYWKLHSIRRMGQAEFADFFDRAIYVITERWMPEGTVPAEVRAELLAMIEPNNMPWIIPDQPAPSIVPDQPERQEVEA